MAGTLVVLSTKSFIEFVMLESMYVDRVPPALSSWLSENVDEAVWGAIETGTSRDEGAVWLIATETRNALAAAGENGRFWLDLPALGTTTVATRFTRQLYLLDGKELFDASRLGSSRGARLFELAFLPRGEGLLEAARDHVREQNWRGADGLLAMAEQAVLPEDRLASVAYLNLAQKITLEQAVCAMQLGREGDALVLLATLSDDRPGDDLLRATEGQHASPGWLLTLALAHEEAGQPASAASVYGRMWAQTPKEDVLLLAQARAFERAGDDHAAVGAYADFIGRRATDDVTLTAQADDITDFAAACLESAELLERLGRSAEAAERSVAAIRRAPFEPAGYTRLFGLRQELGPAETATVVMAAEILHLLNPAAAAAIADLPPRHQPIDLPGDYTPLDDATHDRNIVHAGERESSTLAQRWVGALTRDERDTRDIERHAQRIDDHSASSVLAVLESVAKLAAVDVPRLYLSHGSAGIEVLGASTPFVLLGACHLDEGDDRHLPLRELAFALGTQVEHIRANHVLLTSSEFWRTFGTKSATALLALLPLGDLVSRLTDGSVLKWVSKFGGSSNSTLRAALELAEKRVKEGATGQSVQSAYTASLARVRSIALEPERDQSSLVKERLADFARAAQYTADRVGLLAADDIRAAISAMVRLSPSLSAHASSLNTGGFLGLTTAAADDPALHELTLRVAELLRFALSADYQELRATTVGRAEE